MAIQATQSTSNPAAATASTSLSGNNQVTQADFLKLLISQLQNQDPLKPLDNQEFAQQLATFNSLQQLINVNQNLGTLSGTISQSSQFNAAGLLGKQVVTNGNHVNLTQGAGTTISYNLGAAAANVSVAIKDGTGTTVRQFQFTKQGPGNQSIQWDGKDSTGAPSPTGSYTVAINAIDAAGKTVTATGQFQGIVTGVDLGGAEPMLEVGGAQVPLSSVITVR